MIKYYISEIVLRITLNNLVKCIFFFLHVKIPIDFKFKLNFSNTNSVFETICIKIYLIKINKNKFSKVKTKNHTNS